MTQDYLGSLAFAQNCAAYAPYLTYVYPRTDQVTRWQAVCHVKAVIYSDPGMPNSSDSIEWPLVNGSFANVVGKDATGAISHGYPGASYTADLFDPYASDAKSFLQAVVDGHYNYVYGYADKGTVPAAWFFDNWNDLYAVTPMPSDFTTYAGWAAQVDADLAGLNTHGAEVIVNTLSVPAAYTTVPSGVSVEVQTQALVPPITAAEWEGCYTGTRAWAMNEQAEIETQAKGVQFWCLANEHFTTYAPTDYAARTFLYASFLLTYDPKLAVFGEQMTTASGFHVFPEAQFVPLEPAQTAKTTVDELKTAGVYSREFAACYYRGALIGPCAVVVNPSTITTPVNLSQYAHSMVLNGSDIIDGGTATFDGPAVTALGPGAAAILVP